MIGERVLRVEDRRLLTGAGRYTADIDLPDQAYVAFVRSPYAHAEVRAVEVTEAASAVGVLTVLTGQDYVSDGLMSLFEPGSLPDHLDPTRPSLTNDELVAPPAAPPIVVDRVRYVGEIVALVVAETAAAAIDAAELVVVDAKPLPSVTDARLALADGAPQVWEGGNLCAEAERGDATLVATTLEEAAHIVHLSLRSQRVHGSPIEPRSALATFDADAGCYELYAPSQGVHRFRQALAKALGVKAAAVRVVTPDVGGAFGLRIPCSNEYPLLLWAARRCGRPVKWEGTRSEGFLADVHGRDTSCDGTLGLDDDGRVLALRLDYLGNVGAHPLSFAVLSNLLRMAGPPYDVPAMHVTVRGAFTNTAPTSVYRGAGRPQVTYIVERLMDLGADEVGLDRAEIRRRNLISPTALPYRTRLGLTYDSGPLPTTSRRLSGSSTGTTSRRADVTPRSVASWRESGSPTTSSHRRLPLRANRRDGRGQRSGRGGDRHPGLGARPSDQLRPGRGGHPGCAHGDGRDRVRRQRSGCRGLRLARRPVHAARGNDPGRACEDILEQGRRRAAECLGLDPAELTPADGRFVAADGRSVGLFDLSADGPLTATAEISTRLHAHPNGVAACEVEIDPETGALAVTRYVSVDDVGRAINPMIVEGQLHGGSVQGIGEALLEEVVYDHDTGQLLTGSFLNYGLPSTAETPSIESHVEECPTASNPLGVKGAGEAGITPAGAVIVGAAVDALRAFGIRHLDTPLSPERIWTAIRQARTLGSGEV